ncbi:MAG: hypothetical protein NZT61_00525 [Deltaproteobacteria bacterium]|nr:hypothetical protein [Deltaproteobacteria bacterium]
MQIFTVLGALGLGVISFGMVNLAAILDNSVSANSKTTILVHGADFSGSFNVDPYCNRTSCRVMGGSWNAETEECKGSHLSQATFCRGYEVGDTLTLLPVSITSNVFGTRTGIFQRSQSRR